MSVQGSGCSSVLLLVLCLVRKRATASRVAFKRFCHCFDIAVKIMYLSKMPQAEELFGSWKNLDVQRSPRNRFQARSVSWACWAS